MWVHHPVLHDSTIWPGMDPASLESLRSALRTQELRLQNQEENTSAALQELARCATRQEQATMELREMIKNLASRPVDQSPPNAEAAPQPLASDTPATYSPAPGARLGSPVRFSGDSGDYRAFLTQCEIHFEFPTERSKVAYAVSHLAGEAEIWATAVAK